MANGVVRVAVNAAKGVIYHQPATSGSDAKGREWSSSDGFYFACQECDACGIPGPGFRAPFIQALVHLAAHR